MSPNFLVIGAQKCATSSLCELLGAHPDVFMCEPKEPFYFSHDEIFARGPDWYASLFDRAAGKTAVGEGSTTYTMRGLYPHAAERIAAALPGARLIYIVRDPFERMQSHWMHLRTKGARERLEFNAAVRSRPEYIENSLYKRQIDVYLAHYPDDRILVLFFDDFKSDRDGVLRRCFEFLGVDPARYAEPPGWRAAHESTEGREDTSALTPLRSIPFFERLRDLSPHWVREPLRRMLKKPMSERPRWDDATREWAAERLVEDNLAFLARYGKPDDLWPDLARFAGASAAGEDG